MKANRLVADGRLSLAQDMLVASGWRENGFGWAPPEHVADLMKRDLGLQEVGGYSLPNAMLYQLQYDEAVRDVQMAA